MMEQQMVRNSMECNKHVADKQKLLRDVKIE